MVDAPRLAFAQEAHRALQNPKLRGNFRRAMDGLMQKRAAQFEDPEEWRRLRARGTEAKRRALARLPELLEQLEQRCRTNGIHVHWAENSDEANAIILDILQRAGAKRIVKGKSMVTEETHLNAHLAAHGITAIESDLGEYIIQLAQETPSHIVMPCIHKNKSDISQLFADHLDGVSPQDDVDALTAAARRELRRRFADADAGISGVNFAVAETGTLVLIENEGNGRLSTTLPPLHIAVTGIEKIVERLDDIPPLLSLLTRSATGQAITTYVNMITRPRQADERDGPQSVHLVLLDNGRSRIFADPELSETLRCIRCAACMNHCPVYGRVGGHSYSFTYPGPIGKILNPQLQGLDIAGDQPHASSLCGACAAVCPVSIPIPDILTRLRTDLVQPRTAGPGVVQGAGSGRHWPERIGWRSWQQIYQNPALYRLVSVLLTRVGNALPKWLPMMREWTSVRRQPRFAPRSLHELAKRHGFSPESPGGGRHGRP